jgi:hypothetical protein
VYINAVLSSMGAWRILTEDHAQALPELEQALASLEYQNPNHAQENSVGQLHQGLNEQLETLDWDIGTQISLKTGSRTFYTIDFLKDRIAGKLILNKQAFILSSLLASFPLSVQIHSIDLGFVLVPMHSLKKRLPRGISDFESTCKVLQELPSVLIKHPFLIIGFSCAPSPLKVTELTSELDQLLLTRVGYTLSEMLILGEKPNYDFKVQLPERIERITKEVCALANLPGGGILLFGISDEGEIVGIKASKLDKIKLRITGSIRNLCDPIPFFEFFSVNISNDPELAILVCQVDELKRKPCLVHSRAYVRSGPSAQRADSAEIRRMVLE